MNTSLRCFGASLIAALLLSSPAVAQWNDEEEQKDCKVKKSCAEFKVVTTIPDCQCTDIVPAFFAGSRVNGTCLGQVDQGNCDKSWMQNSSTDEVESGFCDISCGRCDCCKTYAEMLPTKKANLFLQMANAAGLKANLSSPAYSFTILAPPDAAIMQYLKTAGITLQAALANIPLLQKVVSYHILPNVPVIDAWWSTPFFLPGTVLATLLSPQATIRVSPNGALNGLAMVSGPDSPTCKGNVIPISAVLMPPAGIMPGKAIRADPSTTATAATKYTTVSPSPATAKRAAEAPQEMLKIAGEPAFAYMEATTDVLPTAMGAAATGKAALPTTTVPAAKMPATSMPAAKLPTTTMPAATMPTTVMPAAKMPTPP